MEGRTRSKLVEVETVKLVEQEALELKLKGGGQVQKCAFIDIEM